MQVRPCTLLSVAQRLLTVRSYSRFILEAAADKAEKVDKIRFLVQAKCISDEQFGSLSSLRTAEERSSEVQGTGIRSLIARHLCKRFLQFNKLWEDSPANDRKMKLKVEFTYPSPDRVSTPIARGANFEHSQTSASGGDNILNELQTLRKKYDAVVEYTVHVTAERDTVVAELEELKKENARDPKKKGSNNTPPRKGASSDLQSERRVVQVRHCTSLGAPIQCLTCRELVGVFVAVSAGSRHCLFRCREVHSVLILSNYFLS